MIKKHSYNIIMMILFVICLVIGCKKDTDTKSNTEALKAMGVSNELKILYEQLPTLNFGNIKLVNNDILQFESIDHYDKVWGLLNEQYNAWTKLFLDTYFTGDEDELDKIIDKLNFDDRLPLIMFEQQFGILDNSLRTSKDIEENEWLAQGANGSPPSDEIFNCPIEQTLASKYHEICIENTICQMRPNGYRIVIPISDIKFIDEIRRMSTKELVAIVGVGSGAKIPLGIGDVVVIIPPSVGEDGGDDCGCSYCYCYEYKNTFTKFNGTDHKFKLTYHFRERWLDGNKKTTVTMTNYKYNSKKDEWVNDYSSYCRLDFSTKLYLRTGLTQCIDKGRDGKTGSITQVHSKSKNKTFDSKDYTDNINNSYIACRHKGVEFKFNPKGEVVP
jgi:hypothetical protein